MVVAIGGTLAAYIFSMGSAFLHHASRQKTFYGDHVSVTDQIQLVKGRLVHYNNNNNDGPDGKRVILHSRADENAEITSLSDLMLSGAQYSFDVPVGSWGMGRQRIRVNVYDVYYFYDKLSLSLRSALATNSELVKAFPSPVNTQAGVSTNSSMESESETTVPDTGTGGSGNPIPPWENFGEIGRAHV
jgi:hypothetical protein